MVVRDPRRVSVRARETGQRRMVELERRPQPDVPKPVKQATEKFIKKYRDTLRDLEKF